MKVALFLAAAGASLAVAAPAVAKSYTYPVYSDSNPRYLDYKTDLSEARRELRNDLRRANDPGDRIDAWREYRREVADARYDFRKEMAERGVIINNRSLNGSVRVGE